MEKCCFKVGRCCRYWKMLQKIASISRVVFQPVVDRTQTYQDKKFNALCGRTTTVPLNTWARFFSFSCFYEQRTTPRARPSSNTIEWRRQKHSLRGETLYKSTLLRACHRGPLERSKNPANGWPSFRLFGRTVEHKIDIGIQNTHRSTKMDFTNMRVLNP